MKKWIFIFCLFMSVAYPIKETRIIRLAYVDYAKIVKGISNKYGEVQFLKNEIYRKYNAKIADITKSIQEKEKEFQDKRLSETARSALQMKILDLQLEKLVARENMVKEIEDVVSQREDLEEDRLKKVIAKVAKDLGFHMVLSDEVVLSGIDMLDITEDVLRSL